MLAAIIIACASIVVGLVNALVELITDKKMKKCNQDKQAMRDRTEELEKEIKELKKEVNHIYKKE